MAEPTFRGPAEGEGPTRRWGPVDTVALLSDVHGNVPALEAVLADARLHAPDLYVFTGDLTWGAEPDRTIEVVETLGDRAIFVRGNAERAVLEITGGEREAERPREAWMATAHSEHSRELLRTFSFNVVVEVNGLGAVRFCHGSPRSDIEVITPATPTERLRDLSADIEERVLASGHTHLQFDRTVEFEDAGRALRSINPGSVGLPYHLGEPGTAYWALLGPDVRLMQSTYDIEEICRIYRTCGDPNPEQLVELLLKPPTPDELIEHAESRVFAD